MEVAKLLSDVSRLKKMVAAKDAQIEALNSRCETLEDDVLEARSERDRLRQAVAQLEQRGSTNGSQPALGEASASEALQQRVEQAEARAAAAAECAADAQASLAAAMDDFERDLEQREQSQYAQALREQAERSLMLGELDRLERAALDGRSHPPDRSASTQRYLEESIPISSRDQALVASLVEELGKLEAANDALKRRQLELEEAARLEIEELRDQLIQQTEMELHALEDPCTRSPRTTSLSAPHRSFGMAKEDGSTGSYVHELTHRCTICNTRTNPRGRGCQCPRIDSFRLVSPRLSQLAREHHLWQGTRRGTSNAN
ncbi:hypothetical protein AB1Y20_021693 [Prymnesium parvum]|uniref:Uncharacterized protein n=1 Tax=Prymnesium parvum TaxID=97485 RepID=A0AB34JK69_PRYPA